MTTAETPTVPPPPAGDSEKPNPFARLVGVLINPVETMRSVSQRPDWLIPLLVILAITLGSSAVLMPHLDFETQYREMGAERDMSEQQIEQMVAQAEVIKKFSLPLTAVFVPITLLVIAGFFLLATKIFGGAGGFKQAFSVTNYAWMTQMVKTIIVTALVIPRGQITPVAMDRLLLSNLGFLADPQESPMAFAFLGSIDVFSIWFLALVIIGFAEISKLKRSTVAAIAIATWLVYVVIKVGLASLQG